MIEKREDTAAVQQLLSLKNRKVLEVSGVSDVVSFDEESVELSTQCGTLTVEGENLHVQTLNLEKGSVCVEGTVNSLAFEDTERKDPNGKSGLFGKLFH